MSFRPDMLFWASIILRYVCHSGQTSSLWAEFVILNKLNCHSKLDLSFWTFFPIFHVQMTALIPIFCQKKVRSLKTHFFSYLVFSRKNVHFLNNTVLSIHFYQNFHEKPTAVMPILDQKSVHSIKTTLYYRQKSQ